jgi:hypothetical protein
LNIISGVLYTKSVQESLSLITEWAIILRKYGYHHLP